MQNAAEFNALAVKIFHLQYQNVAVYRAYCDAVHSNPKSIKTVEEIPFLPIQFFKSKRIYWDQIETKNATTFMSSDTTETVRSKHHVFDLKVYEQSFTACFEQFYGPV